MRWQSGRITGNEIAIIAMVPHERREKRSPQRRSSPVNSACGGAIRQGGTPG